MSQGKWRAGWFKTRRLFKIFWLWFRKNVAPEIAAFCVDNMDVALEVVASMATQYANEPGAFKRDKALDTLGIQVAAAAPGLKFRNHWLSLLLELAVAAFKASQEAKQR